MEDEARCIMAQRRSDLEQTLGRDTAQVQQLVQEADLIGGSMVGTISVLPATLSIFLCIHVGFRWRTTLKLMPVARSIGAAEI